jgi:hypothetical protein
VLKSESVLQDFVTRQALYCVWIRANETLGAHWFLSGSILKCAPSKALEKPRNGRSRPILGLRKRRPKDVRRH